MPPPAVPAPAADDAPAPRSPKGLLLALLLVLGLTLVGVSLVLRKERETEAVRLQALAGAKAQQMGDWVRERRASLRILGGSLSLAELYQRWQAEGDAQAGATLTGRLADLRRTTGVDAMFLLDLQGGVLWSSQPGLAPGLPAEALRGLPIDGLLRGPYARDGRVQVDFLAPLAQPPGLPRPVLVMRTWADSYLLPVLTTWHSNSPSGEARLAWREADGKAMVLRAVRGANATTAALREGTPGTAAPRVLDGEVPPGQAFEGTDPTGQQYLIVARPVPGTAWMLLAGVTRTEILHNAALPALAVALAGGMALLAVISLTRLTLKQREIDALERLRQAAQARQISEQRLALAVEGAALGLWDWNLRSGALDFNERWPQMLGFEPQALAPTYLSWEARVHPEDLPRARAALRQHLRGEAPAFSVEYRQRHRDGHWVWLLTVGRVVERTTDGRARRAVGIFLDISERRRNEEELARYRQRLEAMVAERTAQLAEASARAEAASQAKSRFLANMSHEIRTPLNAVLGLSQLLARMTLPERARAFVGHIEQAGEQLLALTNDVLDLSRIEAGELHLEQLPFELPALLETVRAIVQAQAGAKGLALRWEPAPDLPRQLLGDPLRLRQVLINLLGNAVKFTPQGSVTLRVALLRREGALCRLRFDVVDTGIGITAEQRSRIFEAFTQADSSITRRFGGTGLGLSIVRRLVTMMDGELALHSEPGRGSTFSVTLNLQAAPGN